MSVIAKRTGISPRLMRQYASGVKFLSDEKVKKIEAVIHHIGKELSQAKITIAQKVTPSKKVEVTSSKTAKAL